MELNQNSSNVLSELLTTKSGTTKSSVSARKAPRDSSALEIALEKAMKLPRSNAHEVWRILQLLVNNEPLEGQSAALVSLAMEFDPFPVTWKVLATKAFEHEHLRKNRESR